MTFSPSAMNSPSGGSTLVRSATSVRSRESGSRGSAASSTLVRTTGGYCRVSVLTSWSVEEVGLLAADLLPQRLEREPTGKLRADVVVRLLRHLGVDVHDLARGLRDELHLAGALHGDEPPHGGVDARAHGQQAVVAKDDRLVVAEGVRDALALLDVGDDAGVVVEERVVVVERRDVLRDRLERLAERRQRAPIGRMRVRSTDDVGTRGVHLRVDRERPLVDVVAALDDVTAVVDPDQVGRPDVRERHAEGVDPERVRLDRVTCGDVARDAFLEAELREQTETGRQPLLAMLPLLLRRGELRHRGKPLLDHAGRVRRRPPRSSSRVDHGKELATRRRVTTQPHDQLSEAARSFHSRMRPSGPSSYRRWHSGQTGSFFGSRLGTQTLPQRATTGGPVTIASMILSLSAKWLNRSWSPSSRR